MDSLLCAIFIMLLLRSGHHREKIARIHRHICLYIQLHWKEPHFFLWRSGPTRAMASSFLRFLDHTQRCVTVGRTPLDEWSARRRDLYLTTHNTNNRQISMPPVGFEPTISAGERPQTYALDRTTTGTGQEPHLLVPKYKRERSQIEFLFKFNFSVAVHTKC